VWEKIRYGDIFEVGHVSLILNGGPIGRE